MMNVKDEYVMMESILNENQDVYLEEKMIFLNSFTDFIFKKIGFEKTPTENEWKKEEFQKENEKRILILERFLKQKTKLKTLTPDSIKNWILEKTKLKTLTPDSIKKWLSNKFNMTYTEEYLINEMTADGIMMTIPISYVIFVLMMVFMEDVIAKIKKK